jgi:hypothetical protein
VNLVKKPMCGRDLKNLSKRIDREHKEKGREGVPLLEPSSMLDGEAGHTIKKDPGRRGDKQGGNSIPESIREATLLKEVNDVIPTYRVESLSNAKLEQKGRIFVLVKSLCKVLNMEEIIVDASLLNK